MPELRGGSGTKSGGYIHKVGYHASLAIVEQLARDPTLASFSPDMADILVVPANDVPPSPGPEEVECFVQTCGVRVSEQHLRVRGLLDYRQVDKRRTPLCWRGVRWSSYRY